jgi:hypothetical protein
MRYLGVLVVAVVLALAAVVVTVGGSTVSAADGGGAAALVATNANHYKCYDVVDSEPFTSRTVTLRDQFESTQAGVLRPVKLCNPVDKNGEGIPQPQLHLVCYEIVQISGTLEHKVLIRNQFGDLVMTVDGPDLLCVPSDKIEL